MMPGSQPMLTGGPAMYNTMPGPMGGMMGGFGSNSGFGGRPFWLKIKE